MRRTKGQAAMEFLMTYGWAILAAIIVIGVLAIYVKPGSFGGAPRLIVGEPLYGVGATINTSAIQIEVRNQGGEILNITGASITFTSPSTATCTADSTTGNVEASSTKVLTLTSCTNLPQGERVNADIVVTYRRSDSALNLQSTGSLTGQVP